MTGRKRIVERAVMLAGSVEALASILSVSCSRVDRWIAGAEPVPRNTIHELSRRIAQAERAASRVKAPPKGPPPI